MSAHDASSCHSSNGSDSDEEWALQVSDVVRDGVSDTDTELSMDCSSSSEDTACAGKT